ncbi:MAG: NAD(P)-dependent glycerol-3-phosphate dehydrogenase, partial [Candidatus Aminicenantes bacterium]|nr:NAD(P)-dependent glycerol-3-phosphate dehydrogenase [Candidatus Aminicenantes bacterium]
MKATVIGGGSWGSAFALHLGRLNIPTRLWIREDDILAQLNATRENIPFLPGFRFPDSITFTGSLKEAVQDGEIIFFAVPSKFCRSVFEEIVPFAHSGQIFVSLTKGIEEDSLMRMSEVITDVFSPVFSPQTAVLSGPSFAREVAGAFPTAVVIASLDCDLARTIQNIISNPLFRCYSSMDVPGVELAGSIKNVIAVAAGITDGLQLGYNSRAALITRGIAEISRLGKKLGAQTQTFLGLAGIGDLVLTCTGELSRNHRVGFEIGRGRSLSDILSDSRMVAE